VIVPQQFKCDLPGCGKDRTAANHWVAVRASTAGLMIYWNWDYAVADGVLDDCRHFCGPAHALQFISSAVGSKKEGQ